jgi:signal transduction histidine kinase
MKKSLALLLLAVLVPSVVLAWLALRSAEEQRIVLERRTAELYQKETESVAAAARALVGDQRHAFAAAVAQMLAAKKPDELAGDFTAALAKSWPQKAVGFAINDAGSLLCPTALDASTRAQCQEFLWDNGAFIGNKTIATVYPVPAGELSQTEQALHNRGATQMKEVSQPTPIMGKTGTRQTPRMAKLTPQMTKEMAAAGASPESGMLVMKDAVPSEATDASALPPPANAARNVTPQQAASMAFVADTPASQLTWATGDFRQLTGQGDEGVINRFVQDRLNMIFWVRPPQARQFLFGCLVEVEDLRALWAAALPAAGSRPAEENQFVLAVLDDKARPVAIQPANAQVPDWKHPFVASEIGEALPHWEATLYLAHPEQLAQSAGKIRHSLMLLIAAALAAIACGGGLVLVETRRQLALAQQKTDFVSNVSHELKTPLTSIRMFAELMLGGRVEPAKREQYLRIIMVEAERLTRLINTVLDFARLERRQKRIDRLPLDLHAVLARVWETHEPHLRDLGFTSTCAAAPGPYPVLGDADALTQVLVNLLSNAEKYCNGTKEITLRSIAAAGEVCVSVLDRGSGVPPGEEARIFEPFYRADDSLASGIQGAGLGLALARRLILEHEGEITCGSRPGGGSEFTFTLPLAASA